MLKVRSMVFSRVLIGTPSITYRGSLPAFIEPIPRMRIAGAEPACPELLESPLNHSIVQRAKDKGLAEIYVHNLRDYTLDKHRKVDD